MELIDWDNELERIRRRCDPQEQSALLECNDCGTEIYAGEEYFYDECDALCEACYDERLSDLKNSNRRIAGED